jgi:hypothetical protein
MSASPPISSASPPGADLPGDAPGRLVLTRRRPTGDHFTGIRQTENQCVPDGWQLEPNAILGSLLVMQALCATGQVGGKLVSRVQRVSVQECRGLEVHQCGQFASFLDLVCPMGMGHRHLGANSTRERCRAVPIGQVFGYRNTEWTVMAPSGRVQLTHLPSATQLPRIVPRWHLDMQLSCNITPARPMARWADVGARGFCT